MNTISNNKAAATTQQSQIYDKAFFMNEELNDMVNKLTHIKPTTLND